MASPYSTSDKSPAFQFYPKDYLSDAKTRAMNFTQRGMYWDLVSHCWLEGGLPADPKAIARILGQAPGRFVTRDWPVLSACFRLVDGKHQHPRLEHERRRQDEWREKSSTGGRRSADHRTKEQPPVNHKSTTPPTIVQPTGNIPSPVFISEDQNQERVRVPAVGGNGDPPRDAVDTRAAAFIDRYCGELYPKFRKGAFYRRKPAIDWGHALDVCATWADDAWLDQMAELFLKCDLPFAENGSRTLGQFAATASWCDSRLRESGRMPASEAI